MSARAFPLSEWVDNGVSHSASLIRAVDSCEPVVAQFGQRMSMARKSTGKRLRFEILKRDGMRCRYCGATPMHALLHVDHVVPVAEGGTDDPSNLVTSCRDCNLGKSDVPLDKRRLPSALTAEEQREHAAQIRDYLAAQKEVVDAKRGGRDEALTYWTEHCGDRHARNLSSILAGAVTAHGLVRVCDAIDATARGSRGGAEGQVKYFCGIVRRWREKGYDSTPIHAIPPTPAAKTYSESEFQEARWHVAIEIYRAYWTLRMNKEGYATEFAGDFEGTIRKALTESRVGLGGLFELFDEAFWGKGSSTYLESKTEERLVDLVERANNESDPCLDLEEHFYHMTSDEFDDESRRATLEAMSAYWWHRSGGESLPGWLMETLTDGEHYGDQRVYFAAIDSVIALPSEQRNAPEFQRAFIWAYLCLHPYGVYDSAPIRKWPEFSLADADFKAQG